MTAGKLRHPSIPHRTAFRVAVQHEDRARFAPGVGEVVDHIVKIEIWRNAQCVHGACPFRFSRTLSASSESESVLDSWFVAFSFGKPVPTFPENARTIAAPARCHPVAPKSI